MLVLGSQVFADAPGSPTTRPATAAEAEAESAASEPGPLAVLQLRGDVELDSPIVRLADVAEPVGPPPEGWDRAAVASVGLLPTDGRRLRIERQRLSEMLYQSKLLGERVRWSGPETVSLRYVPSAAEMAGEVSASATPESPLAKLPAPESTSPEVPSSESSPANRPASFTAASGAAGETFVGRVRPVTGVHSAGADSSLVPAERNRIRRMIEAAFERTYEQLDERYELVIDDTQPNFGALEGLRGIRTLQLSGEPGEGPLRLVVDGDTELERVESPVRIELDELPLAVVANQALNRGDIIAAGDVRLQPVSRERFQDGLLRDVESVVGMEVKRPLSAGRLIDLDDITAPLVIRRGDLVEVRVVAGGVTVTTSARALGTAAAGEPVSVETQSPRRKLIGRAVAGGVVEIVTRPPTTSNPSQ